MSSLPVRERKAGSGREKFLFLFVGLSVALWWKPLASDLGLALSSEAHSYILLILPLSLSLIYFEPKLRFPPFAPERTVGGILLSGALVLRACAEWNLWHFSASINLSVNMGALVVWWIGSVVLCFGLEFFRLLMFPICFLFLIVPLPDSAMTWVTTFLQQQSAQAASLLFGLVGVPVTQNGVVLSIPGLSIEVAQECSSIRSSTILVVLTLVLAQLFLRSSWRKILLVLAAVPLSIAKNAIRIFTIAQLGTRVNPSFLHGKLHEQGGVVFLGMAVMMVVVFLWMLRQSEKKLPLRMYLEPLPADPQSKPHV